jgi:hypothetical protein
MTSGYVRCMVLAAATPLSLKGTGRDGADTKTFGPSITVLRTSRLCRIRFATYFGLCHQVECASRQYVRIGVPSRTLLSKRTVMYTWW